VSAPLREAARLGNQAVSRTGSARRPPRARPEDETRRRDRTGARAVRTARAYSRPRADRLLPRRARSNTRQRRQHTAAPLMKPSGPLTVSLIGSLCLLTLPTGGRVVAQQSQPSQQIPQVQQGSTTGDPPALKPTNHPLLPADASQLWMAPSTQ